MGIGLVVCVVVLVGVVEVFVMDIYNEFVIFVVDGVVYLVVFWCEFYFNVFR